MLGEDNTLLTRAGVDQILEKQRANDMMKLKIINLSEILSRGKSNILSVMIGFYLKSNCVRTKNLLRVLRY